MRSRSGNVRQYSALSKPGGAHPGCKVNCTISQVCAEEIPYFATIQTDSESLYEDEVCKVCS